MNNFEKLKDVKLDDYALWLNSCIWRGTLFCDTKFKPPKEWIDGDFAVSLKIIRAWLQTDVDIKGKEL